MIQYIICLLVSLFASIIGNICGIGGGVIIKPVLDMLHLFPVSTISFLSGCCVLSMSTYSVIKSKCAGEIDIEGRTTVPLGVGAATGGILGKTLFDIVKSSASSQNAVGAIQAVVLFLMVFCTLIYTVYSEKIRKHSITNPIVCVVVGLALGLMSAFLGIGGGPINLVVLSYFFAIDGKKAAVNSLFVIFLSQFASLLVSIFSASIPEFPIALLIAMVLCGIFGGFVGRRINKSIGDDIQKKLFICLLALLLVICTYNFIHFIKV